MSLRHRAHRAAEPGPGQDDMQRQRQANDAEQDVKLRRRNDDAAEREHLKVEPYIAVGRAGELSRKGTDDFLAEHKLPGYRNVHYCPKWQTTRRHKAELHAKLARDAEAMQEIWGARPVRIREGGSIPIVATFAAELKCPVLLLGFGLHDDGLHSQNEKFNISHFYNGIRSVARLLDRVGEV